MYDISGCISNICLLARTRWINSWLYWLRPLKVVQRRFDEIRIQPVGDRSPGLPQSSRVTRETILYLASLTLVTRQFYLSQLNRTPWGDTRLCRPLYRKFHFLLLLCPHACVTSCQEVTCHVKVHDLLWFKLLFFSIDGKMPLRLNFCFLLVT